MPLIDEINGESEAKGRLGTSNLRLCFLNQMASIIFTNSNIETKNDEALKVALCDNYSNDFPNAIVKMDPLSSVTIEIVVLNGDFGPSHEEEGILWSVNDFNKSVLNQREGKRPIIVGHDIILPLKHGVGKIEKLSFTDNSSWTRTGKFRLGARIKDPKVSRILEAVTQPFKVMDHRGEVNKKHHPPKMDDEIWRLEGIGKGGAYHTRLSSHNITTVNDFLMAYLNNPSSLRELLGNKVPKSTWKAMVDNALECLVDIGDEFEFSDDLIDPFMSDQLQDIASMLQDPPLLPHEKVSTSSYSHDHGAWTEPK